MSMDTPIKAIEEKTEELIRNQEGYFLVEVKIKPANNVKVFVDADNGASIDRLVQVNRQLYKWMEEAALFPGGDFSLEVSSPGLDEPLKLNRQYVKNIGRQVEVMLKEGTKIEGKLLGVNETAIVMEEEKGKNKKKELVQHTISFSDIKSTKIQIRF
ncbi:MAG: ribosome maturation factor [Bacteroidetes bacterium]|nr:ribosome maturation factor [Bacteroidota bacterium]